MTEWAIEVQKAKQGDMEAFDKLTRRFQNNAVAYAYALLGDFGEAEDAAQEAFLQAFRDLPDLNEPLAFPGWLRLKVARFCDRRTRRRHLPTVALDAASSLSCREEEPYYLLEKKERYALVYQLIRTLPLAERNAITLYYIGGHAQKDIAEFLGISLSALKKRLQRTRSRLQERMLEMMEDTLKQNAPSRNTRFTEYNALIIRLTQMLEQDEDTKAAYLAHYNGHRSDGFGPQDDVWSSLTLHLVYADAKMDSLAVGRRAFAAKFGEPLLVVEAPQNAPDDGYYLMAIYDGEAGPYEVDWYWRPETGAVLPSETIVLFDKIGLLPADVPLPWRYLETFPPALVRAQEAMTEAEKFAEKGRNTVSLFWAMWMIAARGVARSPTAERLEYASFLCSLWRDAGGLIGLSANALGADSEDDPPAPTSAAKIARLRELGKDMETLMPQMKAKGCSMPEAVVAPAYRFLEMIAEASEAK